MIIWSMIFEKEMKKMMLVEKEDSGMKNYENR